MATPSRAAGTRPARTSAPESAKRQGLRDLLHAGARGLGGADPVHPEHDPLASGASTDQSTSTTPGVVSNTRFTARAGSSRALSFGRVDFGDERREHRRARRDLRDLGARAVAAAAIESMPGRTATAIAWLWR